MERQTIGLANSLQGAAKDNGIDGSFGLGLTGLTFHGTRASRTHISGKELKKEYIVQMAKMHECRFSIGDRTPIDNLIRAGSMRSEVKTVCKSDVCFRVNAGTTASKH